MDKNEMALRSSVALPAFPYDFAGQKHDPIAADCGACDMAQLAQTSVLQTRRFATGTLIFTQASGALTAATGQVIRLFSKGAGESGSDAQLDGLLTDADTDAFSEGALVTGARDHFLAKALHLTFGSPFVNAASGATRDSREWMDGYRAEAQRRAMDDCHVVIEHGEGTQPYKCGPIGMYPSQSGAVSVANFAQVGAPLAGAVIPFRAMLKGGAKSTSARLRVVITLTKNILLAARGTAADADMRLPIRAELLGFAVIDPSSPRVADSKVEEFDQRLARQERMLSAIGEKLGLG